MRSVSQPRRSALRLLVRLIGPVLLAVVILSLDDKAALWSAISGAAWLPLSGAILINIPVIHLKVVRWRSLLLDRGYEYSLKQSYAAVLPSLYLGMVTPGRVGDALRIQYVKREINTPYAEGLAVTVMDRFCDLYVLAAFVAIGVMHFATALSSDLVHITWVMVSVATLAPLVFLLPGPVELLSRVLRRLTDKWHASVETLLGALRGLVKKAIIAGVPITIAAYLLNYAQGYLVAQALGVPLSFADVASLLATTSLLGLMPVSVSGVGVREAFLALVFPALGLAAAHGVAYGLVVFAVIYLTTVLIGFIAWQVAPPPFGTDEIVPTR
jgi:uncharacterized protein (TIRG00374 family)